MRVALIDNGSLEPAAHGSLRAAAAAIGERTGTRVEAVSWRHSDRIEAGALEAGPARTLANWIRAQVAAGEREFLFVPFFISPQGAIGSFLRRDLDRISGELGGVDFSFTDGLGPDSLSAVLADRVREASEAKGLDCPAV